MLGHYRVESASGNLAYSVNYIKDSSLTWRSLDPDLANNSPEVALSQLLVHLVEMLLSVAIKAFISLAVFFPNILRSLLALKASG
jgi:hypothetical protein